MKRQPAHYNAHAVCPGRPVIGHAHLQEDGVISLMLWCMPLNNQLIDLKPKRTPKDEE